jgi:hypothetical protein
VVHCVVSFWVRSDDRQVVPCDVQSGVVGSSIEKWSSIAPRGSSVCRIRSFQKHTFSIHEEQMLNKGSGTQPSLNIYSRAHNTVSQNISESSPLNIRPMVFCSEPISIRLTEALKFNMLFAVLPGSTMCKLHFECCAFFTNLRRALKEC